MGPPDTALPTLWVVTKAGVMGEAQGVDMADGLVDEVCGALGRVSSDNVRRQEARTMEKDEGAWGSWVEMYSR